MQYLQLNYALQSHIMVFIFSCHVFQTFTCRRMVLMNAIIKHCSICWLNMLHQKRNNGVTAFDACVFAYNTSRQEATKHTPFSLMFGRQSNLPIDIDMQSESIEELCKHYDKILEPDHQEQLTVHVTTLPQVGKKKKTLIKYKKQYDKKCQVI